MCRACFQNKSHKNVGFQMYNFSNLLRNDVSNLARIFTRMAKFRASHENGRVKARTSLIF